MFIALVLLTPLLHPSPSLCRAMLLSLSWEGLVLLVCGLLLLPRIVGVVVNVILIAVLQTQPNVRVSIAGVSLRRITEIRLELLHVPLSPLLTARIVVSIDEVALTPSWSKWLTISVRGANAHFILSDTPSSSSSSSASRPAPPPRLRKPSRSAPTSIPELLSTLSSNAPSAALPPVQRGYQYICNRLLIFVFHAIAISLSHVLVIVQKDQFRASARLAALLVYVDRSNSNSSRLQQLHVKLGGIEVRVGTTADVDMLQYPATEAEWTSSFTTKQKPSSTAAFEAVISPSSAIPPLRSMNIPAIPVPPPLLVLHPMLAMVEFTLHRYVPTGITRVETRAQGLNVHVDVMRLVATASTALQAFHNVILHAVREQKLDDAADDDIDQAAAVDAAAARGSLSSPGTTIPVFVRGISFVPAQTTREAALHRDHLLRFIPTFVRMLIHRVSIGVYERESNALVSLASSMPTDLYADLIARYGTSVALAEGPTSVPLVPSNTALQASPILRYLELHWSLMAVQVDMKTPLAHTGHVH